MKKYTDPDNQRYVYYIRETLNGYAIQVLNVARDERYPMTPSIAGQCGLQLPDGFVCHACAKATAEAELERLAKENGLVAIE